MTHSANRLPRSFRRIRLELAREPGHPSGDVHTGYTLTAPLDSVGHIDADLWRMHSDGCSVLRFRANQKVAEGRLRRRPGGSWVFHYKMGENEDDDPGFQLGGHVFAPGEYVTIEEDEGAHTYRVVSVAPLT